MTDSTERNVDFVKNAYAAFGNDDWEAFFALFDDGFEWIVSEGFPYGGHYRGREAVIAGVFSPIRADWETFSLDLERLVDGGDTVVGLGQYEAVHGTTGVAVTAPFCHVFDLEAGTIRRFQQFTDTVQFQRALPGGGPSDA